MSDSVSPPAMASIAPFFIVRDIQQSVSFYANRLGFELAFLALPEDPFFAIVRRDAVQLFFKAVGDGVPPLPNRTRHPNARWDAFVHVPDPDALAAELSSRDVQMLMPLQDTDDGLRGFEVQDPDGYILFFGRPR